jgi:hypothetical protein
MAKRNSKVAAVLKFESILWQAADKLRGNLDAAESHTLAALRDTLLPKLLSGELSVSKGPN